MITYTNFRSKIYEQADLSASFLYKDKRVTISEELNISIDNQLIYYYTQINSLEEGIEIAKNWIDNIDCVDSTNIISESKVAEIIKKSGITNKVTSQLVESYIEFVNSRDFSIDPVVIELKSKFNNSQFNKLEYTLKDGSTIALDEQTVEKLSNELKDKYKLVEHMRESKENFMQVIRQLEE